MNELMHFDLVAIGGGFAGICAAVRGAELGLRTAVLEASTDERYLCSSRWAGGIFHVSYRDVKLTPDELLKAAGPTIAGLYAAGGTTGGLEGGGALGYVGGLIKACVFGLRTTEHAAGRRG